MSGDDEADRKLSAEEGWIFERDDENYIGTRIRRFYSRNKTVDGILDLNRIE
jgi:hypothetical protein